MNGCPLRTSTVTGLRRGRTPRGRGGGFRPARVLTAALVLCAAAASPVAARQHPLFDGATLSGWEVTDFLDSGPVTVEEGAILLARGEPMTGITWVGEFPRVGYEVTLEAMRVSGRDFFAAITFPVGADPCTLVLGGWGGRVVGLSSIDGADASENATRRDVDFEEGRWYRVRLRVTEERIEAWLDDERIVDVAHRERLLSIRVEVWPNQPFGIATWETTGAVRRIALRKLTHRTP